MESKAEPRFWHAYRIGVQSFLLAQLIDLTRFATLWISVWIAHVIQRFFLSQGWLPLVVHTLGVVEDAVVVVTITIFLLLITARTIWLLWREVQKK